jgi:hypothetical protein
MIYVPMSLEIRYVGKEFVRFFGQKGGKSVASVLLSGINAHMSFSLRVQSFVCGVLITGWCVVMILLGFHLGEKHALDEAEDLFEVAQAGGRARLNSAESSTSKASVESLPDDDYFVGEGLSMTSDSQDVDILQLKKLSGSDDRSSEGKSADEHDRDTGVEFLVRNSKTRYDACAGLDLDDDIYGYDDGYIVDDLRRHSQDDQDLPARHHVAHHPRQRTHTMPIDVHNHPAAALTSSKLLLHTAVESSDDDEGAADSSFNDHDGMSKLKGAGRSTARKRLPSADDTMRVEYVDVVFMDTEGWDRRPSPATTTNPENNESKEANSGALRYRGGSRVSGETESKPAFASGVQRHDGMPETRETRSELDEHSKKLLEEHQGYGHGFIDDSIQSNKELRYKYSGRPAPVTDTTSHPPPAPPDSSRRPTSKVKAEKMLPADVKVTRKPASSSSATAAGGKAQKSQLIRVGSHFVNLSKLKKFT